MQQKDQRSHLYIGLMLLVFGIIFVIYNCNRSAQDENLVGVWKLTYEQANGMPKRIERHAWVIDHNSIAIVRGYGIFKMSYAVNTDLPINQIDVNEIFLDKGIYQRTGSTLKFAFSVQNANRPTTFKSKFGGLISIIELEKTDIQVNIHNIDEHVLLEQLFGPAKEYPERLTPNEEAETFVDHLMRNPPDYTPKYQVLELIERAKTEINNGGINQFFYNSTGNEAKDIIAAFRKINANQSASIIERGCLLFKNGMPSTDLELRRKELESFSLEKLKTQQDLDQEFYHRQEDLNVLLKAYYEAEP